MSGALEVKRSRRRELSALRAELRSTQAHREELLSALEKTRGFMDLLLELMKARITVAGFLREAQDEAERGSDSMGVLADGLANQLAGIDAAIAKAGGK